MDLSTIEGREYYTAMFKYLLGNKDFLDAFETAFPDKNFRRDCIPSLENHFRPASLTRMMEDFLIIGDDDPNSPRNVLYRRLKNAYEAAKSEADKIKNTQAFVTKETAEHTEPLEQGTYER